jgi:hypothetical protein
MNPPDARLDDYRFQMGHDAGNLALALDHLTDAITALNQHLVYYRLEEGSGGPPRRTSPRSWRCWRTRRGWCRSRSCG